MTFSPYVHFQGNCAEAMEYYAAVFGADDLYLMRYAEAPDAGFPDSDLVIHGHFSVGGSSFMASDYPPGVDGDAQKAMSVSYSPKSVDEGRRLFDRLAEGGEVISAFAPSFFSPGFGMLKDRFGTHWMIVSPSG